MRGKKKEESTLNFHERLKQVRKSAKVSKRALGKRVHVSADKITLYESGELSPGISMVVKLAEALDAPIDYLVCGSNFLNGYKVVKYIVGDSVNIVAEDKEMLTILLPNDMKIRMSKMEFIERFNMSQIKLREEIADNIISALMSQHTSKEELK